MFNMFKYIMATIAAMSASVPSVMAAIPVGESVPILGTDVPFAGSGILGLAAIGVIGGVWLARRKRDRT